MVFMWIDIIEISEVFLNQLPSVVEPLNCCESRIGCACKPLAAVDSNPVSRS
jgi:hypothetical protein